MAENILAFIGAIILVIFIIDLFAVESAGLGVLEVLVRLSPRARVSAPFPPLNRFKNPIIYRIVLALEAFLGLFLIYPWVARLLNLEW